MTTAERHSIDTTTCSEQPWMARLLTDLVTANAHTQAKAVPLQGGVSSDIYRVDLGDWTICVKRALPKLKVAADWQVPVERNRYEVEWMRVAGAIVPAAVPRLLGEDSEAGAFAMEWLPA